MKGSRSRKTSEDSWADRTPAWVLVVAAGMLLLRLPVFIRRVFCDFQVNQGEAVNVEFARLLLRAEPLYPDPSTGPYLFSAYPPLFSFLQSLLIGVTGGVWWPGRLIAFASFLGCATLLIRWGWKRWGSVRALLVGVLLLLSPTWAAWGTMVRNDTFALLLHLGAFLVLLAVEERGRGLEAGRLTVAALLVTASAMVKQNGILLVPVYAAVTLIRGSWKRGAIFSLGALGMTGIATLILAQGSEGRYLDYAYRWISLSWSFDLLQDYLRGWFLPEAGWLLVPTAALLFSKQPLLLKAQVLMSLFWLAALGRTGAAENYQMEFILYALMGAGAVAAPGASRHPLRIALVSLLGLACFAAHPAPKVPGPEEKAMKRSVLDLYSRPGETLALDLDLPVMAGKPLLLQPMEYQWMVQKGAWSTGPLIRDVQAKRFSMVELYDLPEQTLLPPDVVEAVRENYRVLRRVHGRVWMVPTLDPGRKHAAP